ncbi:MAG: NUDIX hydrolase [Chitinophagaceae bacterium]
MGKLAIQNKELIKDPSELVLNYPKLCLSVDCVIFGFSEKKLKVLVIQSDLEKYNGLYTLLGDVVHVDEETDNAAYRVLKQRTGLTDVFLEQVKAFSHPTRHPGGRVVTIAYCSLINIKDHDLKITDNDLHWHEVDTIDKMGFDHKKILITCYEWLQKMIKEDPLAFNLLPDKFSMRQLQNVYETIWDIELDRRNFRKKFASMDLLVDVGEMEEDVSHRPGKLFKFNFEKYHKQKKTWLGVDF